MLKFLPSLILGFICLLLLTASTALAQAPRSYYDWSSTVEIRSSKVLGITAYAQEATPAAKPEDFNKFNRYFLVGNLTPDNPFHFIKTLEENVQMAITFDPAKKEEMRLSLAGSRLEEMKQLADQNKTSAIAAAAKSYEQTMSKATDNIIALKDKDKAKDLTGKIEVETAKHTVILENVAVKVPEKAKDSVEKAIEASWKGTDAAADLAGRPAVPADMVARLQSLKSQGLLTEEEVNKLIATKTRTEARYEIKKYVKEGVVPEADFLRMNENVKSFYQEDFFKIHEMKRFYEMKKLESEKPDDTTLKKIQDYAKTYKPGDVVPTDFRRYWVPVIRLEEIQNTIRPDLIDADLIKNKEDDYKRFTEIVERYKPRPEDLAYMENFLKKNPNAALPPEYERMKGLGEKYGAQCGPGNHWIAQPQGGGMCVPDGQDESQWRNMSRVDDFAKGKACSGMIVAAKGPGGACGAYSADCMPPGWTRTNSCSEPQGQTQPTRSCPTNSHWVPVTYMPEGGYCIPNYTPVSVGQMGEQPCSAGYHRNFPGGPCLANYEATTTWTPPPITLSPGSYPSPYYGTQRCGSGYHWVPEPINPNGGYCAPDNYPAVGTGTQPIPGGPVNCQLKSCPEGQYIDQMSCSCRRPGENPYPSACTPPAYGCTGGSYWNPSTCSCFYPPTSGGTSGSGGGSCSIPPNCGPGYYVDYGSCSCRSASTPPPGTSCVPPSSGCPSGGTFNVSTCTCIFPSNQTPSGSPPSGYGSCPAGNYWNGTACVPSTPPPSSGSQPPPQNTCVPPSSGCPSGGTFDMSTCSCHFPPPPQQSDQPPPQQPPPADQPPPQQPPPQEPPPPQPPPQ